MHCPECGNKLEDGSSFCGECGKKVTKPKPTFRKASKSEPAKKTADEGAKKPASENGQSAEEEPEAAPAPEQPEKLEEEPEAAPAPEQPEDESEQPEQPDPEPSDDEASDEASDEAPGEAPDEVPVIVDPLVIPDSPVKVDISKPAEASAYVPTLPSNQLEINAEKKQAHKNQTVIVTSIIVAIVVIAAVVGFALWSSEQNRLGEERYAQVDAVYAQFVKVDDGIVPDVGADADRAVLVQQYVELDQLIDSVDTAKAADDLRLYNGSQFDTAELESSITEKMGAIADWLMSYYDAQLVANSFLETDTAESLSAETCQARIDGLTALRSAIESDAKVIDTQRDPQYQVENLLAQIAVQLDRGRALLPEIQAREDAEAAANAQRAFEAKADNFIGEWRSEVEVPEADFKSWAEFIFKRGGQGEWATRGKDDHYEGFTWKRAGEINNGRVNITVTYPGGQSEILTYNIETDKLYNSYGDEFIRK